MQDSKGLSLRMHCSRCVCQHAISSYPSLLLNMTSAIDPLPDKGRDQNPSQNHGIVFTHNALPLTNYTCGDTVDEGAMTQCFDLRRHA